MALVLYQRHLDITELVDAAQGTIYNANVDLLMKANIIIEK